MVDTWGTMSETVTLAGWAAGFVDVGLALLLRPEGIMLVGS
jgi:hypothetical protein